MLRQQIERAAHAAEHAQAEHIDLHEAQRVDVVLVPLDDLAIVHRGGFDGDEFVQAVLGEHEAAGVLRQVAREADQLARQVEGQAQAAVLQVQVQFGGFGFGDTFFRPAPDLAGERAGKVFGQAECLADLAHGTSGAVADHGGAQRGAVAAVGVVDPLDDFLAALVLEVDVDVRGFAPLGADEALEQQAGAGGVDGRDAEHEADRGVGGGPAALAEDAFRFREANDAVDGQEVWRVVELGDQGQFVVELAGDGVGNAVGVGAGGAVPGESFQCMLGGLAGGADLGRVLVAQLVEREAAAIGDFERAGDGVGVAGVKPADLVRGFQVAVGEALAPEAGVVDRAALADAGEDVLQDAAAGGVVEHVAGHDGGDFFLAAARSARCCRRGPSLGRRCRVSAR